MESFARVFPLDWTTVEYVSAVVGVLIVVLCLLAFLLRRSRHRHERHSRAAAEQLAALTAGEMMARSQEDGDRFSLKEGNSIATLITDAVLPGQSGPNFARQIEAARPALRVLFISGYSDDAILRLGLLNEQEAFLQKPFGPRTFVHKVQQILRG